MFLLNKCLQLIKIGQYFLKKKLFIIERIIFVMSIKKSIYSKSLIRNFAIEYEIKEKTKFIQSQDTYFLRSLEHFSKNVEMSQV